MAVEENEESLEEDLKGQISALMKKVESLEKLALLSGENDSSSCYLTIHSGVRLWTSDGRAKGKSEFVFEYDAW